MNLSIVKSYLKIHIKNSPIYSWFSGKGGGYYRRKCSISFTTLVDHSFLFIPIRTILRTFSVLGVGRQIAKQNYSWSLITWICIHLNTALRTKLVTLTINIFFFHHIMNFFLFQICFVSVVYAGIHVLSKININLNLLDRKRKKKVQWVF